MKFLIIIFAFVLTGCVDAESKHQRRLENLKAIEICHDGVTYVQFVSSTVNLGLSVKRERDGKVELCKE